MIDANGNRTTSLYDARGRSTRRRTRWARITSYLFDAAGNTTLRTDARGWPTTYTNDALNRVTQAGVPGRNARHVLLRCARGGCDTKDWLGITDYNHDRQLQLRALSCSNGMRMTYSNDPVGNRILMLDAYSWLTSYAYDAQNRLTR